MPPVVTLKSSELHVFAHSQDMFDPEYYLSVFPIKDLSTGATRLGTGKYRDVAPAGPREEVFFDAPECVNRERNAFYCVSVPGEAGWARDEFAKRGQKGAIAGGSRQNNG